MQHRPHGRSRAISWRPTYGAGPIRGLFQDLGGGGLGSLFVVAGTGVYRNGVSIGAIPGTDLVRWAASSQQVVAVAGGYAYVWDGVTYPTFTQIAWTALPQVNDVAFLADRFVFVALGSNTWWYSEIFDATNVTGLDFASNENSPAPSIGVMVVDGQLAFFGGDNLEFWSPSADATAPFQPNSTGQYFRRGILARDTLAFCDNALFWVGENGVVYRTAGGVPERISSSSIEDKIRQCANPQAMSAFDVTFEGHEFYVLNVNGIGSYAYDISRIGSVTGAYGSSYGRGEWNEWSSYNWPQFRCRVAASFHVSGQSAPVTYVGDDSTGDVWGMQVGVWQDAAGPLIRKASAFVKIEEGRPRMDALVLHAVVGVGAAVDPGSLPVAEMRYSDDLGRTFSKWRAASLGAMGDYDARAYWTRLGQMRAPGRLIEVRCSDPVDVAFSHLELNPVRPAQ